MPRPARIRFDETMLKRNADLAAAIESAIVPSWAGRATGDRYAGPNRFPDRHRNGGHHPGSFECSGLPF
jgi:hypothetical protein